MKVWISSTLLSTCFDVQRVFSAGISIICIIQTIDFPSYSNPAQVLKNVSKNSPDSSKIQISSSSSFPSFPLQSKTNLSLHFINFIICLDTYFAIILKFVLFSILSRFLQGCLPYLYHLCLIQYYII